MRYDDAKGKIMMAIIPSKNTHRLGCQGYVVDVHLNDAIRIHADFVMFISGHAEARIIAEAQRRLAMFFCSGDIEMVKSGDKPRCFYCASLNELDAKQCSQCGALL